MKTNDDAPSANANDSTTVPITYSGATTQRSSTISTTRISSSTSGTISFASRDSASTLSCCSAVTPPTSTVSPGGAAARAIARRRGIRSIARVPNGSIRSSACADNNRPSRERESRSALETPGARASASRTGNAAAGEVTTSSGAARPAG